MEIPHADDSALLRAAFLFVVKPFPKLETVARFTTRESFSTWVGLVRHHGPEEGVQVLSKEA